jgi:hypothetical protein
MQITQGYFEIGTFSGTVGQTLFLEYLRGRSGWGKKRREFMLAQADYYRANGVPGPVLSWTTEVASMEHYEYADRILTKTLCSYVDEWLESGRTPDGDGGYFEEPKNRRLSPSAQAAVGSYLTQNPPRFLVLEGNRIGAVVAEEKPQRTGPDNPITEAEKEADRLLVHFMESDARWNIARCSYCKKLFYPKRIQELYKRGAECPGCRSKGSMAGGRRDWTKKVLKHAAEAWPRWKPTYGPRPLWVARRVNSKLSPDEDRITGNWVTRHTKEIEGRAQAGVPTSQEKC